MYERKDRKIPNFFIVGAPKCGTTALNEYLRDHPNIFISTPKEPMYFLSDLSRSYRIMPLERYLELFKTATEKHMAVGEASTLYLYSTSAISNIYRFNKNARIIAMLRNPVDLVYSFHSQQLYSLYEDEKDFETAWRIQPLRERCLRLPRTCPNPAALQYSQIGRLGAQVERLLSIFPCEQVKIILFDDFVASPKTVYEDVLSFLGVPYDGRADFPRINKNKTHMSRGIGFLTVRRPWGRFTDKLKNLLGIERFGFTDALRNLNDREAPRKPLSPELRAEMENEFREDIEKLSNLIGRDLSHWIAGKQS